MAKRWILRLFKLFGVALFLLIVSRIDRQLLLQQFETLNLTLFGASVPVLFLIYYCKTERFRSLVHTTDVILTKMEVWKIFHIGVFLAGITPAKLGELGRAAYLQSAGVQTAMAVTLSFVDRIFDVICIGLIGIASIGILFGWQWSVVTGVVALIGAQLMWWVWKATSRMQWVATLGNIFRRNALLPVIIWTLVSWSLYFLWAILIARAVHIDVSLHVLISAFTITGIISLLPIAPSGLGTRDAALLVLLAPYGVHAEQAVSLAFLMFISIIFSGILGAWYWLKGVQ